jgi:hypothetical protein
MKIKTLTVGSSSSWPPATRHRPRPSRPGRRLSSGERLGGSLPVPKSALPLPKEPSGAATTPTPRCPNLLAVSEEPILWRLSSHVDLGGCGDDSHTTWPQHVGGAGAGGGGGAGPTVWRRMWYHDTVALDGRLP